MTNPETIAERAKAAAIAKKQRQQQEREARQEAERQNVERLTARYKAGWVPLLNQELATVLGEPVEFDWDWNVPMKSDGDSLCPVNSQDRACLQAKVDPIFIEAHPDDTEHVTFRLAYGGWSGPLRNIEDLGEALLAYRARTVE